MQTAVREYVDPHVLEMYNPSAFIDGIANKLVIQLERYVASETLESKTIRYPANWKEAVKERFAPGWFTRKWPVRFTTVTVDVKALYPKVSIPRERHHLHVYVNGELWRGSGGQ